MPTPASQPLVVPLRRTCHHSGNQRTARGCTRRKIAGQRSNFAQKVTFSVEMRDLCVTRFGISLRNASIGAGKAQLRSAPAIGSRAEELVTAVPVLVGQRPNARPPMSRLIVIGPKIGSPRCGSSIAITEY